MARGRIALLLVTAFLWCGSALAYWTGSTPRGGIELKEGPGSGFRTIRVLPKGTIFNAVDRPQQGYYRVRTAHDTGWVDASQLSGARQLRSTSRGERRSSARYSRHRPARYDGHATYGSSGEPPRKRFAITALANYDLYSPTDLNHLINANDFNDGMTFGLEFQYFLLPNLALGLRGELLSKSVLGNDSTTGDNFQFGIKSTSITVGAEYFLLQKRHFALGVAGYAGVAPSSFTSTDTSITNQANVTELSGTALTAMGLLEGSFLFNPTVAVTAEAGYRYLKTSDLQPNPAGAGSEIFVNSTGYSIDLSGPVLGLGFRVSF